MRPLVEEVADEWFEEKIAEGELIRSFGEDGNEVLKFNEEHPKQTHRGPDVPSPERVVDAPHYGHVLLRHGVPPSGASHGLGQDSPAHPGRDNPRTACSGTAPAHQKAGAPIRDPGVDAA